MYLDGLIKKKKQEKNTDYSCQQQKKEREDKATDTGDLKGITREYYKQLYANIFQNFNEVDKFLIRH